MIFSTVINLETGVKIANVLNVSAQFGIMVVECSNVHFVSVFCVKMISLSIRQSAKCWSRKIINVDRVINSDNGAVYRFYSDSKLNATQFFVV